MPIDHPPILVKYLLTENEAFSNQQRPIRSNSTRAAPCAIPRILLSSLNVSRTVRYVFSYLLSYMCPKFEPHWSSFDAANKAAKR